MSSPERRRSGQQVALLGALLAREGQRDMLPNNHLRQALAQLIGGASADGAAAITGRELVPALRPRGRRVEHARALTRLDA